VSSHSQNSLRRFNQQIRQNTDCGGKISFVKIPSAASN